MRVEEQYYTVINPLTRDYLNDFLKVDGYYSYDINQEQSFHYRAHRLQERKMAASRSDVAEVVRSFHGTELSSVAIEKNIQRLRNTDSLTVVGGQQAGLMMGPLYTLYKGITIIQLARREEERLGQPVIPVFWIAGEDHDWEEVNHCYLEGPHKVSLSWKKGDQNRRSISQLDLGTEGVAFMAAMEQWLPDSPYKKEVLNTLEQFAQRSTNLSQWFARILHYFFGEYGLLMIDAADPQLRRIERPFFEHLIKEAPFLSASVAHAAGSLEEKGYSPQVEIEAERVHLFLRNQGDRTALYFHGEKGYTDRTGSQHWSQDELLARLHQNPEDFSNNVVSRPLMQEYIFPTLAVVLGESEIAYWGLLKRAFSTFFMEMPILFPRTSITLVRPSEEKWLYHYRLTLRDVWFNLSDRKKEWLEQEYQLNSTGLFAGVRKRLEEIYKPLLVELAGLEAGLRNRGEENHQRLLQEIAWLERETIGSLERRGAIHDQRFQRLAVALHPFGSLQERIYSILPYWNAYGNEWVEELLKMPLLSKETHRVVYL